jgi:hypothetical protein
LVFSRNIIQHNAALAKKNFRFFGNKTMKKPSAAVVAQVRRYRNFLAGLDIRPDCAILCSKGQRKSDKFPPFLAFRKPQRLS